VEPTALSTDADERLDAAEVEVLDLLLHDYGYDYRRTPTAWLKRAIRDRVAAERLRTTRGLREKARHDEACRRRLLHSLAPASGAMFQEPAFYLAFREKVVPLLRTYPFVRIWHVGCATGEEVYSMAILLAEAGLYDRCRLYATDLDETALREARDGIVPLAMMREHAANYLRAGGEGDFSRYYTAGYERAIFRASLKRNLIFARHDPGTDGPFNDFHAVVCRDVLRALAPPARARASRLVLGSLVRFGFLCLGTREPLASAGAGAACEPVDASVGIYRRVH
jgi:chemotaxis protein methyltransferase CheR